MTPVNMSYEEHEGLRKAEFSRETDSENNLRGSSKTLHLVVDSIRESSNHDGH
jgi:hypothetical protein